LWAIHPGGRAILDTVASAFSLSPPQIAPARRVLAKYGNMSSASVMFVLDELLGSSNGVAHPGAAVAFGPGLSVEAMEFTYIPAQTPDADQIRLNHLAAKHFVSSNINN
jgi:predicted naringenin-chalcone synthase